MYLHKSAPLPTGNEFFSSVFHCPGRSHFSKARFAISWNWLLGSLWQGRSTWTWSCSRWGIVVWDVLWCSTALLDWGLAASEGACRTTWVTLTSCKDSVYIVKQSILIMEDYGYRKAHSISLWEKQCINSSSGEYLSITSVWVGKSIRTLHLFCRDPHRWTAIPFQNGGRGSEPMLHCYGYELWWVAFRELVKSFGMYTYNIYIL